MQTMLLIIFFNSLINKIREGKYNEAKNDLHDAVEALEKDE